MMHFIVLIGVSSIALMMAAGSAHRDSVSLVVCVCVSDRAVVTSDGHGCCALVDGSIGAQAYVGVGSLNVLGASPKMYMST